MSKKSPQEVLEKMVSIYEVALAKEAAAHKALHEAGVALAEAKSHSISIAEWVVGAGADVPGAFEVDPPEVKEEAAVSSWVRGPVSGPSVYLLAA